MIMHLKKAPIKIAWFSVPNVKKFIMIHQVTAFSNISIILFETSSMTIMTFFISIHLLRTFI